MISVLVHKPNDVTASTILMMPNIFNMPIRSYNSYIFLTVLFDRNPKSQTETSCFLTDDSGRSCEDYINSLDYVCTPFEAKFTGKACNDNNRGTCKKSICIYYASPS